MSNLLNQPIDRTAEGLWETCESPAEEKFAKAMASALGIMHDPFLATYGPFPPDALMYCAEMGYKDPEESCWRLASMRITAQHNHGSLPYRADFAISFGTIYGPKGSTGKIWVEIDGHDFHERTKEQAAKDRQKDRAISATGWHMMRFTASETHRDPLACIKEITDYIILNAW